MPLTCCAIGCFALNASRRPIHCGCDFAGECRFDSALVSCCDSSEASHCGSVAVIHFGSCGAFHYDSGSCEAFHCDSGSCGAFHCDSDSCEVFRCGSFQVLHCDSSAVFRFGFFAVCHRVEFHFDLILVSRFGFFGCRYDSDESHFLPIGDYRPIHCAWSPGYAPIHFDFSRPATSFQPDCENLTSTLIGCDCLTWNESRTCANQSDVNLSDETRCESVIGCRCLTSTEDRDVLVRSPASGQRWASCYQSCSRHLKDIEWKS